MSEDAVVRKSLRPAGAIRRGAKSLSYGFGLALATLVAIAWWGVLIWGIVTLAAWVWHLAV